MRLEYRKNFILFSICTSILFGCQNENEDQVVDPHPFVSDTISLMFYNAENLFDFENDGTEYPEYKPGTNNWTEETHRRKVENIASVIAAAKVSVVALCEVEDEDALKDLYDALVEKGCKYPYRCIATSENKTATSPALLSRFPIKSYRSLSTGSDRMFRPILQVQISDSTTPFTLFVNHWPSKQHPESARISAAQTLAAAVSQLSPGTDYAVVGDLNSDYDECMKLMMGKKEGNTKTGLNHVLNTVVSSPDQIATFVNKQNALDCDSCMYDPWLDLPPQNRFSHKYQGIFGTLDHILLPKSVFDTQGFSYIDNSFAPFTWNGKLLRDGQPFRWQVKYQGRRRVHVGEGYSDHLPVRALFIRKPFSFRKSSNYQNEPSHNETTLNDLNGWSGCGKGVTLQLDTVNNEKSFKVSGPLLNANGCLVNQIVPLSQKKVSKISFTIRGNGKLSVRVRSPGEKWTYYNGSEMEMSKSARYEQCFFPVWKKFVLSLPSLNKALAIEIRSGKDEAYCFWMKDFRVE